jgi:hypothetical protein
MQPRRCASNAKSSCLAETRRREGLFSDSLSARCPNRVGKWFIHGCRPCDRFRADGLESRLGGTRPAELLETASGGRVIEPPDRLQKNPPTRLGVPLIDTEVVHGTDVWRSWPCPGDRRNRHREGVFQRGGDLHADVLGPIEKTKAVAPVEKRTLWKDWWCSSPRQHRCMTRGLVEEATYESRFDGSRRLLVLWQWTRVGKNAIFGLARYEIVGLGEESS